MVIRVWTEREHETGFRARLRFGTPLLAEPSVVHATDPEQVLDAVRNWLSSLPGASVPDKDENTP
ncbi:hypothetical protein E3T48_10950 [Cryobacterium fucosi]|uniref:Uncharacterized protein n=2 Tax=Cryobacterium fucosi TaxID=1259157 RepID=A0A4R9B5I9_9MICO|nr:hypothetical protein E3T48_10950 [Cryobacterium fucosi]